MSWLVDTKEKRIAWVVFFIYGIFVFACVHQSILGYQMMKFSQVNDLFLLADSAIVHNTLFGRAIANGLDYGISTRWFFTTIRWYDILFLISCVYIFIIKMPNSFHKIKYNIRLIILLMLLLYSGITALAVRVLQDLTTTLRAVYSLNRIGLILIVGSLFIIVVVICQIVGLLYNIKKGN